MTTPNTPAPKMILPDDETFKQMVSFFKKYGGNWDESFIETFRMPAAQAWLRSMLNAEYERAGDRIEAGMKARSLSPTLKNQAKAALEWFTESFETDFMIDGKIVDSPDKTVWRPIVKIYEKQKKALAALSASEPPEEKPRINEGDRAPCIYQERTGQTLEDTLAGRWNNPAAQQTEALRSAEEWRNELWERFYDKNNYVFTMQKGTLLGLIERIQRNAIASV